MDPHELAVAVAARVHDGGDARAVEALLAAAGDIASYSAEQGLVEFGTPRAILVIDSLAGTGPAGAALESSCIAIGVVPASEHATLGEVSFGIVQEITTGYRVTAERGGGVRVSDETGAQIEVGLSPDSDLDALFWAAAVRGRPSLPMTVVLEELVDRSGVRGGYFDRGSAAFNIARIVTGQLGAYVDVGLSILEQNPQMEPAFLAAGDGAVATSVPADIAAAALILTEAGGVVTAADGGPLAAHPVLGSGRVEGLTVVASASAALHEQLLAAIDRGMAHLRSWLSAGSQG